MLLMLHRARADVPDARHNSPSLSLIARHINNTQKVQIKPTYTHDRHHQSYNYLLHYFTPRVHCLFNLYVIFSGCTMAV